MVGKCVALRASLGVLSSVLLGMGSTAHAQSALPPGTTSGIPVPLVFSGVPPFSGTLLIEFQSSVFATNGINIISGQVSSAAFRNASGFIDFVYQFSFDNATNVVVSTVSLASFSNVAGVEVGQTAEDVDGPLLNFFHPANATGSFSSASRPNVTGNGINATLLTGVTSNQLTYVFLVRTEATDYALTGSASIQGGGISAFTAANGAVTALPSTSPEPGTLSLFLLGGLAPLFWKARRK